MERANKRDPSSKSYDATVNRTRADRLQSCEWKAVILPLNHCVLDDCDTAVGLNHVAKKTVASITESPGAIRQCALLSSLDPCYSARSTNHLQKTVNQVVTDRVSGESTLRIALTALYVVVVKSIPSHLVLDVSSSKCFFGTPDYSFPDPVA